VESIGALSDEHAATSLLLGSPPAANGSMRAAANSAAAAAAAAAADSAAGAAGDAEEAAAAASLTPEQEFDACLEHAITCMMAEVSSNQQQHVSSAACTACAEALQAAGLVTTA
jgi:hypothetical protein